MKEQQERKYEFGPFRLDVDEGLLVRDGQRVSLRPKAFETLVILVERKGKLVDKEDLIRMLWPDSFVEEANLTNNIWALRKALQLGNNDQSYIETVPKRGYRFSADVRKPAANSELILERYVHTRIVSNEEEREHEVNDIPQALGSEQRRWTRQPLIVCSVAVCLLLAGLVIRSVWTSRPANDAKEVSWIHTGPKSIAVLPVKSIGPESNSDYLSIGLADALITRLGNVQRLIVRPTSAIRRYTDANQDPVSIGRQQNVDAVLEGSFQRTGDRIRLTVQLIRVADGSTIWSSQFDERFTDIFSVQDSISERVACDLVTRICGEESALAIRQKKINIAAYEAYLRGRYFWNKRTLDGFSKSVQSFREAIDAEPAYARAYAGLGDAYYFLGGRDRATQQESYFLARSAIEKALELDEALSEAHATLGLMAMNNEWNWPEAEREFKRAIELSPNYATAHQWYGEFLAYMGRFDEAVTSLKRARDLDPLSLIIDTDLAKIYAIARRYDEAIPQYQKTLEMDPTFDEANALLGLTYTVTGQHKLALEQYSKIDALDNNPAYLSWFGYSLGMAGSRAEAHKVENRLREISKRVYVSPYWMTFVYVGLGDKDQAFKYLDKILDEHAPFGTVSLKENAVYDPLRSDPRYADVLRRGGFN